jgi:hypothetical protein
MNVSQLTVHGQPTAVIAETTSWEAYPGTWPLLLDEVWSALRPRRTEIRPGRNVMLYKDDVPNVEVGVEVEGSFAPLGRIIASTLAVRTPRGPRAMFVGLPVWRSAKSRFRHSGMCVPVSGRGGTRH